MKAHPSVEVVSANQYVGTDVEEAYKRTELILSTPSHQLLRLPLAGLTRRVGSRPEGVPTGPATITASALSLQQPEDGPSRHGKVLRCESLSPRTTPGSPKSSSSP